MAFLGPNNAIAWAQFRLRGGWKRSLSFTAGVSVLIALLIGAMWYTDPRQFTRTLFGWCSGLLALQAATLVLYISGQISAAIRRDIQNRLLDSHRLMPASPSDAVAGYISGGALQPLTFVAAIFLIGCIISGFARVDIGRWMFANLILFAFAAFVWTFAAYVSFSARLGPALIFIPIFVGPYATAGGGLSALPGLMVILSPIFGESVFDLRNASLSVPATYAFALAAQFCTGAIFFFAAARRYRADHELGLDARLGLLLLACWVAVTWAGLFAWEDFRPRGLRLDDISPESSVIASMIAGILLALLSIAACAWSNALYRRHEILHDPAPMQRPLPALFVLLAGIAMISIIPFAAAIDPVASVSEVITSAAIIAIALAPIYLIASWVYFGYHRAIVPILIWIAVAWVMPIIFDAVRYSLADHGASGPVDTIASCSPIGALIILWTRDAISIKPGLLMQTLFVLIPLSLRLRQLRSPKNKALAL